MLEALKNVASQMQWDHIYRPPCKFQKQTINLLLDWHYVAIITPAS